MINIKKYLLIQFKNNECNFLKCIISKTILQYEYCKTMQMFITIIKMVYYIIAPRSQAGYQTPESKSMTLILTKFSLKLFKLQLNELHVGTSWPMYILTISILNIEKMKQFSVCHFICSLSPILSTIPRHCQGQPRKLRKEQFCYIFPFFLRLI